MARPLRRVVECDAHDCEDVVDDLAGSQDSAEDRDVSFDEADFANMMKQMMGMPSDEHNANTIISQPGRIEELDSEEESDAEGLREAMQQMEDELREAGALDLDVEGPSRGDDIDDPKYHLAKNLLESFKGQVGAAGPTGNLMSSLGFKLPRDEGQR